VSRLSGLEVLPATDENIFLCADPDPGDGKKGVLVLKTANDRKAMGLLN